MICLGPGSAAARRRPSSAPTTSSRPAMRMTTGLRNAARSRAGWNRSRTNHEGMNGKCRHAWASVRDASSHSRAQALSKQPHYTPFLRERVHRPHPRVDESVKGGPAGSRSIPRVLEQRYIDPERCERARVVSPVKRAPRVAMQHENHGTGLCRRVHQAPPKKSAPPVAPRGHARGLSCAESLVFGGLNGEVHQLPLRGVERAEEKQNRDDDGDHDTPRFHRPAGIAREVHRRLFAVKPRSRKERERRWPQVARAIRMLDSSLPRRRACAAPGASRQPGRSPRRAPWPPAGRAHPAS